MNKNDKWNFRGALSAKTRLAVSVVQGYYLGKGIRLTQPEAIDKIVEIYLKRPVGRFFIEN